MLDNFSELLNVSISTVIAGVCATAIMDVWALLLKVIFNITSLNYAMVGRWIGHMANGKLMHEHIANSSPIVNESIIGWTAHYLIGIIFSAALVLTQGASWFHSPSVAPAITIGLLTVAFPFLLMQPCFGMGIAATKQSASHINQLKSLTAHLIFGLGLYVSALLINTLL